MLVDQLRQLLTQNRIPTPLPAEPFPLLNTWFTEARDSGKYDDFNAMALATCTTTGRPSVRIVLCKSIDPANGTLTFFTNYHSRKGHELAENPRAAAVFHWPHATRQARVEGTIEKIPAAESDEYFRSRPVVSRIGAVVSQQSSRLARRTELLTAAMDMAAKVALGHTLERPAHWGGFLLHASSVELWAGVEGRLHERALWERAGHTSTWSTTFLSP
jgi:pyridoxamine 5'-phosphate oxidase